MGISNDGETQDKWFTVQYSKEHVCKFTKKKKNYADLINSRDVTAQAISVCLIT